MDDLANEKIYDGENILSQHSPSGIALTIHLVNAALICPAAALYNAPGLSRFPLRRRRAEFGGDGAPDGFGQRDRGDEPRLGQLRERRPTTQVLAG